MTMHTPPVNASVAPLKNVTAMLTLIDGLKNRPASSSSGFGVLSGHSGYGKTVASTYAQNAEDCLYVEVRDFWTKKKFCQAVLAELDAPNAKGTIPAMMDDIAYRLGSRVDQCLIIDEADKLVDKGMIELARDIQEMTGAAVILVGEEKLPQKLEAFERVHNRVLDWQLASPCDAADAAVLAEILVPGIEIAPEFLEFICQKTDGRTRRVANTFNDVKTWVKNNGFTGVLTPEAYRGTVFTGKAPVRGRG